ncbi:hypothetical protein EZS27_013377 [termite gut metagenome]|uniref:Phage terminase small subunit P27 family n=1 Tax=termite gut metagenome TaxID=433724 RepID=A0A5J4RXU2_9ZZZZ
MKNINTDYSPETQKFEQSVRKFLKKKFGTINKEWEGSLAMLFTNYETFIICKHTIKTDGLTITDRFKTIIKHPLLKVQIDSQIQIVKLLGEFGLTPKALMKLDKQDGTEDNNDPLNEFLN